MRPATTNTTIVIPCAPYHLKWVDRAYESALLQTVPCSIRVIVDRDGRGAGWARNEGLRDTDTDYVVFLDADDEIASDFVERCQRVRRRQHYVYTDWFEDQTPRVAPDCAWVNRTWHPVTTLLPTRFVKAIGGFDEQLAAAEDTDFYIRLNRSGVCGQRLGESLFIYHADGQRARKAHESGLLEQVVTALNQKYKGDNMACCGQDELLDRGVGGEQQPGDVMAQTLWSGNRRERGIVTGRFYEGGWGAQVWVSPEDAIRAPHLFRIILPDPIDTPSAPAAIYPTARAASVDPNLAQLGRDMGVQFAPDAPTIVVDMPAQIPTRQARAARLLGKVPESGEAADAAETASRRRGRKSRAS